MKILNLYAGIGGNRKLWTPKGDEHDITAVELDPKIAKIYQDFFPKDKVIVADAHQYLLDHFKEYDFIWSSPPCQSHSSFRQNICVRFRGTKPEYPDMKLYQEILLLKYNQTALWIVENVKPYYQPFIMPNLILGRHYFWSNFQVEINRIEFHRDKIRIAQIPQLQKIHGINLSKYKLENKRQVLRNCVLPKIGLHILNFAIEKEKTLFNIK